MNRQNGRGIILSIIAMLCLAGMDATGKLLVQTYPIVEIMAVRFTMFFLIVVLATGIKGQLGHIRSKVVSTQILRSLVLLIEVTVFIFAFSLMPLADVHSIAATAPLLTILLAGWYLGEKISRRSWVGVIIGFTGALIIIRPGFGVMTWHVLLPICGAILWAVYQVLSRHVAQFDRPETTVFYTAVTGLVVFGGLAFFNWKEPSSTGWQLLLLNGLLGATGHYLLIKALALAPASILQPFNYAILFWAIVIGLVVFGDLPDMPTLLGAAVVFGAGIYALGARRPLSAASWRNRE